MLAALATRKHGAPSPSSGAAAGDAASEDVCAVCISPFKGGEELRVLPCNHFFHVDCIDLWLARSKQCPHCRRGVV